MYARSKDRGTGARAFVTGVMAGLAGPAAVAEAQSDSSRSSGRRRKIGLPAEASGHKIDYKNPQFLMRYISERGEVVTSRIGSMSAKEQRELRLAIKRARFLGLLPYVVR